LNVIQINSIADNSKGSGNESDDQSNINTSGRGRRGGRMSKLHKIGVGGFVIRASRQRLLQMNPQGAIECMCYNND
jgi:hypothetical protein